MRVLEIQVHALREMEESTYICQTVLSSSQPKLYFLPTWGFETFSIWACLTQVHAQTSQNHETRATSSVRVMRLKCQGSLLASTVLEAFISRHFWQAA